MTQIIGITGGIASGKSTVTAYLREKGYLVIDADVVVHELQAKGGKLYHALVAAFGEGILDHEGNLNRKKLSQQVFADKKLREHLSTIQDRIIREELQARRDALLGQHKVIFMDIPLLFELDYQAWFDQIWLVYVTPEQQIDRLMARNGYSREEAQQRIASQMSLDDKRILADVVIDNNGSIEETLVQVTGLLARLIAK